MLFATGLTIVAIVIGVVLLILVAVLFVEVLASFPKERASEPSPLARPRIAVIVPAHDEALTIGRAIASILPQLKKGDRLLVVADNCVDETAALARAAGAEVISRTDTSRRGKGYALDFGLRHVSADPPDVIIFIDADCAPDPGCLARIANLAIATQRPVQARYETTLPVGAHTLRSSLGSFANRVKNIARPLGCHRLGLPCQLMGTGMAFPWPLFGKVNLATSEIVEDLIYGLEFARVGHPPLFCPVARVMSEFPIALEGQTEQRTRWETGHLNTIVSYLPRLLLEAISRADYILLAVVLDAAVPPLSFLALLIGAFLILALPLAIFGGAAAPLLLAAAIILFFAVAVLLAWWRVGRDVVSLYELALVPGYIMSKIGLYGRVLIGRKVGWTRSKRNAR